MSSLFSVGFTLKARRAGQQALVALRWMIGLVVPTLPLVLYLKFYNVFNLSSKMRCACTHLLPLQTNHQSCPSSKKPASRSCSCLRSSAAALGPASFWHRAQAQANSRVGVCPASMQIILQNPALYSVTLYC
jgi:hypothetical protein